MSGEDSRALNGKEIACRGGDCWGIRLDVGPGWWPSGETLLGGPRGRIPDSHPGTSLSTPCSHDHGWLKLSMTEARVHSGVKAPLRVLSFHLCLCFYLSCSWKK